MRNFFIQFIFYFFLLDFCSAQVPFIRNYSPKEYNASPQNWDIIQDNRGIIYIANSSGVLEYDGSKWRLIQVPGDVVRALGIDSSGMVYVGTQNNFGYLKNTPNGSTKYISLSDQLSGTGNKVSTVWQIFCLADGVYFQVQDGLYKYCAGKNSKDIKYIRSNYFIQWSFFVYDKIYIRSDSLYLLEHDSLKLIPELTPASHADVYAMMPYKKDKILLATRESGLFIYDPENGNSLTPLNSPLTEWFKKNLLYNAVELPVVKNERPDYNYCFATSEGGIAISDPEGNIQYIINKKTGLRSNSIDLVFSDSQGNIWVATTDGISKIYANIPMDGFNENFNVNSRVFSVLRHNGILFIGTNNGLFYLNKNGFFELIADIKTQCWKILPFARDIIVAGGNSGFYHIGIKNGKPYQIQNIGTPMATMSITRSTKDTSLIYISLYNGLLLCKYQGGEFIKIGKIENIDVPCINSEEDNNGDLWVGSRFSGFFRIGFNSGYEISNNLISVPVQNFIEKDGINELKYCRVVKVDSGIVFSSQTGLYVFDETSQKFVGNKWFDIDHRLKENNYPHLIDGPDGEKWFLNSLIIFKNAQKSQGIDSIFLKPLQQKVNACFFEGDFIAWMGGDNGLYRVHLKKQGDLKAFTTIIRQVKTISNDSILFHGSNILSNRTSLDYEFNSLSFYFAATNFAFEEANLFQFKLEGYEREWSSWSPEVKKEYTNLREGNYVFKVRSKNILGENGKEDSFSFTIHPPWYRTFSAYSLYILLIGFSGYGVREMSIRRLRKQKRVLEKMVRERTVEIARQKDQILVQKEIVEEKNKEITDSIVYARRIQNALIPSSEFLKKILPDHFVLYKPKDIVSGDFYWANKLPDGNILIAVADCTGHGVPGAFMSMIGINKLNEIVGDKGITKPDLILNELRREIIMALNSKENGPVELLDQSPESDQINDGMDISLCLLDLNKKELLYSGAMNPIWIIRRDQEEENRAKGEFCPNPPAIIEIKPDKFPIGIYSGELKSFSLNTVQLVEGDMLYLLSDGFADQFGGTKGKKLKSRQLLNHLLSINDLAPEHQKNSLEKFLEGWKGELEQVDDITIVGIRV